MDIANFADDNTPYTFVKKINELIESLEKTLNTLFQWLKDSIFKGNPNKCHLLVLIKNLLNIGEFDKENSYYEKLLGVKIDNEFTFDCHVSDIRNKASKKINEIARIAPYIYIIYIYIYIYIFI